MLLDYAENGNNALTLRAESNWRCIQVSCSDFLSTIIPFKMKVLEMLV